MPILRQASHDLRQRVLAGPPFRREERIKRLDRLDAALADPAIHAGEKFRRTFEAHRIELDYGRAVETYRDLLEANETPRLVDFLSVGRLALYYQTLDGRRSGIWVAARQRWETLSSEENENIAKALRLARKLEPPQLLALPLPVPPLP